MHSNNVSQHAMQGVINGLLAQTVGSNDRRDATGKPLDVLKVLKWSFIQLPDDNHRSAAVLRVTVLSSCCLCRCAKVYSLPSETPSCYRLHGGAHLRQPGTLLLCRHLLLDAALLLRGQPREHLLQTWIGILQQDEEGVGTPASLRSKVEQLWSECAGATLVSCCIPDGEAVSR